MRRGVSVEQRDRLAEAMKKAMPSARGSHIELARRMGCSGSAISGIIAGTTIPSMILTTALIDKLGLDGVYIWGEEPPSFSKEVSLIKEENAQLRKLCISRAEDIQTLETTVACLRKDVSDLRVQLEESHARVIKDHRHAIEFVCKKVMEMI